MSSNSSNTPTPPLLVTATVSMQAPSFVPGSVVSATITLSAKPKRPLASSHSEQNRNRSSSLHYSNHQLTQSISAASSMLASFQPSAIARVDYVVAELSGRWTSDRSWLSPNAHNPANPSIHLDNHAQAPQHSSASSSIEAFLLQSPRRRSSSSSSSTNPNTNTSNNSNNNSFDDPTLGPYAWSAALADANAVGGGGRAGHSGILFRSHPIVVCEREQVPASSQVSFCVDAILPDNIPPSFRGSAMRYGYALVVVVKLPDTSVPHVVRVPFRVLPVAKMSVYSDDVLFGKHKIPVPTPRDVGPRPNRFLQHDDIVPLKMSSRLLKSSPPDDIEIALALSMNGRLTDYKPDVEHKRLMVNEHHQHQHHSQNHHYHYHSTTPLNNNIGTTRPSSFHSLNHQPATASSVLHYLPSTSSTDNLTNETNNNTSKSGDTKSNGLTPLPPLPLDEDDAFNMAASMSKKAPMRVYGITRGTQAVAKVYLAKRVHTLGDSVQIMFDFHGDRACYRIGARLEMHEVVGERYAIGYQEKNRYKNGASNNTSTSTKTVMNNATAPSSSDISDSTVSENAVSTSSGTTSTSTTAATATHDGRINTNVLDSNGSNEADGVVFRKVFGDYGEFVTAARNTEVTFSIPHDAPPSFTTGVVTVRWMVHFMFVIPRPSKVEKEEGQEQNGNYDDEDDVETEHLLGGLRLDNDGGVLMLDRIAGNNDEEEDDNVDDGWKGGKWRGEDDVSSWKHLPEEEVELLRWTLPIVVSGQPRSPWGVCNVNRITHVSMG